MINMLPMCSQPRDSVVDDNYSDIMQPQGCRYRIATDGVVMQVYLGLCVT